MKILFSLILEPILYVYYSNYGLICLKFTALLFRLHVLIARVVSVL